jgi:hypothetical protein
MINTLRLRKATPPSPNHHPLKRPHTSTKVQSVVCGNNVTAVTTPNLTDEFNSRVTLAENDNSFAYDTEKRDTRHKGDNYDIRLTATISATIVTPVCSCSIPRTKTSRVCAPIKINGLAN